MLVRRITALALVLVACGGATETAPTPKAPVETQSITTERTVTGAVDRPDGEPPACFKRGGLDACRVDCDAEKVEGCVAMAQGQESLKSATPWLDRACTLGDQESCASLGSILMGSESARGFQLLTKACDAGSMRGCTSLGFAYSRGGSGFPRDEARASALYQRACDGGDGTACANLASDYLYGRRVPKDETRARELFAKGCDDGAPNGCLGLGKMLVEGRGGPKDETRGRALLEQACKFGFSDACAPPLHAPE